MDEKSSRPNPWTYLQTVCLVLCLDDRERSIIRLRAVFLRIMNQGLFRFLIFVGVIIAGVLGYFVDHIPLKLVLPSLVVSAVTLILASSLLKKRGILK